MLNNKEKEEFLIGKRRRPYSVQWILIDKAKKFVTDLLEWKKEFEILKNKFNCEDLCKILESLKTKQALQNQPNKAPN